MPKALPDLSGNRYSALTVLRMLYRNRHGKMLYECLCDCGNRTVVIAAHLRNGNTKSCSCLQKAKAKITKTTHGCYKAPEHNSWRAMKNRCTNKLGSRYAEWGGRGIKVCTRWLESFENFLNDMGERPKPKSKYSLDRINNNGNYEPVNCRWATLATQRNNQGRN